MIVHCYECAQLVFIPNWILLCLAIIAILYAVALAIVLLRSPDVAPEHKQNAAITALGYSAALVPLLVFLVRLRPRPFLHLHLLHHHLSTSPPMNATLLRVRVHVRVHELYALALLQCASDSLAGVRACDVESLRNVYSTSGRRAYLCVQSVQTHSTRNRV